MYKKFLLLSTVTLFIYAAGCSGEKADNESVIKKDVLVADSEVKIYESEATIWEEEMDGSEDIQDEEDAEKDIPLKVNHNFVKEVIQVTAGEAYTFDAGTLFVVEASKCFSAKRRYVSESTGKMQESSIYMGGYDTALRYTMSENMWVGTVLEPETYSVEQGKMIFYIMDLETQIVPEGNIYTLEKYQYVDVGTQVPSGKYRLLNAAEVVDKYGEMTALVFAPENPKRLSNESYSLYNDEVYIQDYLVIGNENGMILEYIGE